MVDRFRKALMWLLLLALPLQGYAAATMLNCGPNHHSMMVGSATASGAVHDPSSVGHHHGDAGAASVAGDHHSTAANDSGDDASAAHDLNQLAKSKCSACAACCMGVALPPAALAVASFPPAMTPAVFVSAPHDDFLSDGLDRPPRLLLD